jgi:type IV secretory pathway VirJ component
MIRVLACAALLLPSLLAENSLPLVLRGRTQSLVRMQSSGSGTSAAVLFLPGDGGWRGAAVRMAQTIASWGYDVYGLDTKKYLEDNCQNAATLSSDGLAQDMRAAARQIAAVAKKPVLLVGWSQGAAMAVAAVAGLEDRSAVRGIVTLGLPESGVLGWDWKATIAVLARRDPGQPSFSVAPLLPRLTPAKVWMIYGSQDEYTQPDHERALFRATGEPKRLEEIAGANHRFDGHQDELFRSVRAGLQWISAN